MASGTSSSTSEADFLGAGNFGRVSKGTMDVAIKEIVLRDDEDYQKYYRREVEIMMAINHKNIVRLYKSKKTKKFLTLVMEYCEGGDIEAYVKKKGALTRETCLEFMQSIAEAVEYMHTKDTLHRDLNPRNILVQEEDGFPIIKLADFGLARPASKAESFTLCGTPNYMAPEMFPDALGKVDYSLPADIFSVGLIFLVLHNHVQTGEPLKAIKSR